MYLKETYKECRDYTHFNDKADQTLVHWKVELHCWQTNYVLKGDQSSDVMLYDKVASGPMLVNQSLLL